MTERLTLSLSHFTLKTKVFFCRLLALRAFIGKTISLRRQRNNWEIIIYYVAAAKSLQSCPTLRPHRRQPTRLPHPWDSPGKNTGVGCHFLLQCMKVKSQSEVASRVRPSATPWTAAHQAPPFMGFSRQEYWSGCHCLLRIYYVRRAICPLLLLEKKVIP